MDVKIKLLSDKGFKWHSNEGSFFKGYLSDENDIIYKDEKLKNYFSGIDTHEKLVEKIRSANGSFCVILRVGNIIYIAVDRLRSIPLFYSVNNHQITISDDAHWIKEELSLSNVDKVSLLEFKLTGYTSGKTTLYKSINQVQAGEILNFNFNNSIEVSSEFYYVHLHQNYYDEHPTELLLQLEKISMNIFKRLINSVNNRTIVVPLSGGYDSRYIVSMLKKIGYQKVICYTYGRPDSHEVIISKRVANEVGYQWHFIEYNSDTWNSFFEQEAHSYFLNSNNLSSLPHIQDFFAINQLSEKNLIPKDSIIVPGYCGDLLGGSYLIADKELDGMELTINSLTNYIYAKHYNLFKYQGELENKIKNNIKEFIGRFYINDKNDLISINEHFFTSHKASKFVINSLRVYEHFGYQWRMPLWDNELMEFWYRVPNGLRVKNVLYNEYLLNRLFIELNVSIPKQQARPEIIQKLKSLLPKSLKDYLMSKINKYFQQDTRNYNSFNELAEKLLNHIDDKRNVENIYLNKNINHVFSIWFLEKIIKLEHKKNNTRKDIQM